MPFGLLKYGLSSRYPAKRLLPPRTKLKPAYDVVIIGAGGHGLATAYHLAKDHGVRDVAVLDKGYLGGGNTGRNTAIIRANYLTPEGVRFYAEALERWRGLSNELDINVQYAERGHLTLAHSDAAMRTMRWRAEVNNHLGVDSEVIYPNELARLVPGLDLSDSVRHPILGALHHPPGATARHDAVVWGYAARAADNGVELHPHTEVIGVLHDGGRVSGVETTRGVVRCNRVLQAVAGSSTLLAAMAGFRLPIHTVPLQACVSLPLKPFLNPIVVSASLHVYIWQTARGELVLGGATDPYGVYRNRSTLDFKESLMTHVLELFPFLSEVYAAAPVGRHLRPDAGFQPGHGRNAAGELLPRRRLGHLGVQSHAGLRHAHGRDHRQRSSSGHPAPIRARAVRGLPAGW